MHFVFKIAFLTLILALTTACSTMRSGAGLAIPGPLDIDVENAPRGIMTTETEQRSQSLHSFLVGQLSYANEDYDTALAEFERASTLADPAGKLISMRLTELYLRNGNLPKALSACTDALAQDPQSIDLLKLKAGILEALGKTDLAREQYQKILGIDKSRIEVYILLADLSMRAGNFDEMRKVVAPLKSQQEHRHIAYYYFGKAAEAENKLAVAEREYRKAYSYQKSNSDILLDVVRVQLKGKKFVEARKVCEEILKTDPRNVRARKVLSELLIGENRIDDALDTLAQLREDDSDSIDTRFKIALLQIEKQNFGEAVRELSLILAQSPDHSEARFYLASIYAGAGRRKEAIDELFKIQSGQEMYAKSRTFVAFLLRQSGSFEEAEEAIREALTVEPDNSKTFSYLILVLRDAKKYREARELLEEAIKQRPTDEGLLFNYALILDDLEEKERALETMTRVIEINPTHTDALNYVAYAYADSRQHLDRALELIHMALKVRPADGYYLDTLGWIHYKAGDYEEAESVLRQAVQLSGDDVVILEHHGDSLKALGRLREAMEVYRRALLYASAQNESDRSSIDTDVSRIQKKVEELREQAPQLTGGADIE